MQYDRFSIYIPQVKVLLGFEVAEPVSAAECVINGDFHGSFSLGLWILGRWQCIGKELWNLNDRVGVDRVA